MNVKHHGLKSAPAVVSVELVVVRLDSIEAPDVLQAPGGFPNIHMGGWQLFKLQNVDKKVAQPQPNKRLYKGFA